jgi:hypothetical protein
MVYRQYEEDQKDRVEIKVMEEKRSKHEVKVVEVPVK